MPRLPSGVGFTDWDQSVELQGVRTVKEDYAEGLGPRP